MNRSQISDMKEIESTLSLFCRASSLVINSHKSSFHFSGMQDNELDNFKAIFTYKFVDLNEGFCYKGFYLKLANYRAED